MPCFRCATRKSRRSWSISNSCVGPPRQPSAAAGTAGYGTLLLIGEATQLAVTKLSRQLGRWVPALIAWPVVTAGLSLTAFALSDRVVFRRWLRSLSHQAQRINKQIFPAPLCRGSRSAPAARGRSSRGRRWDSRDAGLSPMAPRPRYPHSDGNRCKGTHPHLRRIHSRALLPAIRGEDPRRTRTHWCPAARDYRHPNARRLGWINNWGACSYEF